MKTFKLFTVLGLVLAVAGTASAASALVTGFDPVTGLLKTIDLTTTGPIQFKLNNYDVGTIYGVGVGGTAVVPGTIYADSTGVLLNGLTQTGPVGGFAGEDSWGILRATQIQDTAGHTLLNLGPQEITGIFYGEHDTYLLEDAFGVQAIHGRGMQISLFLDTTPDFSELGGPLARSGFAEYPTVSDPLDLGETLIFSFKSVPGAHAGSSDEFFTNFSPSTHVVSDGVMYMQSGANANGVGIWNWLLQPNFISPGADASAKFTGSDGTSGWLVNSNDPITMNVVPEPITMLSAFLAISGLGAYMRRRTKVVA